MAGRQIIFFVVEVSFWYYFGRSALWFSHIETPAPKLWTDRHISRKTNLSMVVWGF